MRGLRAFGSVAAAVSADFPLRGARAGRLSVGAGALASLLREGFFADLVMVEDRPMTVERGDILSKCGWSPFEGHTFASRIAGTWVNGLRVWDGSRLVGQAQGQRLRFDR